MINKKKLIPIEVHDLIRIGNDNDGGYVIPKSIIKNCDSLLSYGINKNWSFEKDFINKNPSLTVHCYDHTLNVFSLFIFTFKSIFLSILHFLLLDKKRFLNASSGINILPKYFTFFNNKASHFKKRIWNFKNRNSITVKDSIEKIPSYNSKKIFIKMDIEGAEYKVLYDVYKPKKNVVGLAVEFHNIDKKYKKFNLIIDELLKNYHIVHIHGNNYSKIIANQNFPSSVEITLINKLFIKHPIKKSTKNYPITGLDQPNKFSKPDYKLNFNKTQAKKTST